MARKKSPFKIPLSSIGIFPSHWEISTLSRACALVTDGTHDSPKVAPYGYPLVTGKCITGGRVKFEEAYLISERDHRAVIARSKAEFGDILFANIGNSIGELARVESDEEFSIKNVALFKPSERVESLFLKYYLGSPAVQTYIRGNTFGSAQPFIGLGTLRGFPIPLPPLPEQKAIAHILGSLDDKIELNRRMNETLEAMAQALFKSWFVDFDPVIDNALAAGNDIPEPLKAKAATREALGDARKPLPEDIRQYFPCRFEFTEEMGWIPEGWGVQAFKNIAKHIRMNVKADEIKDADLYVGLEHIHKKELFLSEHDYGQKIQSNKSSFQKFDVLFGKLRPYFHKVCIAPSSGICSTDILVFRAKKEFMRSIVALTLFSDSMVEYANLRSTGTRMPRASAKDMLDYTIVKIPSFLIEYFECTISSLWTKGMAAIENNKNLATLRDTLLPKLLSGELRIPDAEKLVEEAL